MRAAAVAFMLLTLTWGSLEGQEPDSSSVSAAWTARQMEALTSPPRARAMDAIRVRGRTLSLWGFDSRGDSWRRDYRIPPRGGYSVAVVGSDVLVRTSPAWWVRPLLEYAAVAGAATLGAMATDDWRVGVGVGMVAGVGIGLAF